MIKTLPAPTPIRQENVARYVEAIGWLTLEVAEMPVLLADFVGVIKLHRTPSRLCGRSGGPRSTVDPSFAR